MSKSSGKGKAFLLGGGVVLVLVLVSGLLPGLFNLHNPFRSETKTNDHSAVLKDLRDISRYEAASGQFQVIIDQEKDTRYVPSVLKGQKVVFVAEGDVEAVVDLSHLGGTALTVTPDRKSATITLPAPTYTAPRIDPTHTRVVSRSRGLLDRIGGGFSATPTNDQPLYEAASAKIAAAARKSELLRRAEVNTRKLLTGLLRNLGYDHVTVTFLKPTTG